MFWQHYHQLRYSSTQFYQMLSRLLTPFYQSDSTWAGSFRDVSFYWMYQIPYLRKQMALTISGLKTFSATAYELCGNCVIAVSIIYFKSKLNLELIKAHRFPS
jgi:hypothetical protein